jgi:hypothetical protein
MATEQASFAVVRFSQELGGRPNVRFERFSRKTITWRSDLLSLVRHNVEFVAINLSPTGNG